MSVEKRKFKEDAVSPDEQVAPLKKRGMSFAQDRLEQIGFHRLSGCMQACRQDDRTGEQQDFIPRCPAMSASSR